MLIDSVHVHTFYWDDNGSSSSDHTIPYLSSITYLPDRYVLRFIPATGSFQWSWVIIRDYTDRFLSYSTYSNTVNGVLEYRYDWSYDINGRIEEMQYYRNPIFSNEFHVNYWKFVPEYDITNRKISETRYHSIDSLNWSPVYRIEYSYSGESLPASFQVKEREPYWNFPYFKLWDVVDNYQIDSLSVYQYSSNLWSWVGRLEYSYYIYPDEYVSVSVTPIQNTPGLTLVNIDAIYLVAGANYHLNGFIRQYGIGTAGGYIHDPYPSYTYWYTWIDENTPVTDETTPMPAKRLICYPNPFHSEQTFVSENKAALGDISIYNIKGQLIRSWKDVKSSELTWDGRDSHNRPVSSGVYLIRARQGRETATVKVIRMH